MKSNNRITFWFYALLAVAILSFGGCDKRQTQRIKNVIEPQQLTFHTSRDRMPSGYTLTVRGYLDGTASITAGSNTPQSISGDVDFRIYHDYFRPSIDVQYSPAKVSTGQLTVELTFH